jgi:hypothetical protein
MTELNCFPLRARVEPAVAVFSMADVEAMRAAHVKAKNDEESRKNSLVICSVADALVDIARTSGFVERFKEVCRNTHEPWKLELELFSFAATSLNCNVWDTVTTGETAGDFARNSGRDTMVSEMPNAYKMPWTLTGAELTMPLWKIINARTGVLELVAASLGTGWLGHHFKLVVRQEPVEWLDAESKVGVGMRRVIVKFFPGGLNQHDLKALNAVKERWGIKATTAELYPAAGEDCECGCC